MSAIVKLDYPPNGKTIGEYNFNPTQTNLSSTTYPGEVGKEGLNAFYGHVSETYTNKLEWPGAYDIYNVMRRRDPTLRSLINAIKMMSRQSTWSAKSCSDLPADKQASDFLQENIEDMSHTVEDFIDDTLSFLWAGWSSFEICLKRRNGPNGEHASQFNDGKIGWRKLAYRRQSTFSRWCFDDAGGFGGWYQAAPPLYTEILLPADKLLHFVGERDGNNPEGISLFESAYEPWHFVTNLQIINGIGWQRTFVGLPVFEFTDRPNADDKAAVETTGQALTVDEKQFISVPSGIKFRLESTANSGAESLLNTIKMYRALMLEIVLGEFMMQSLLGTGSFAAQSDKSQLFLMAVNGYLDKIAAVWNRFGVSRLFDIECNKAPGMTGLPYIAHSDIMKPNLSAVGSFIQQIAPYIKLGDEDEIWVRELAGLPKVDMAARKAQEETAPVTPPPVAQPIVPAPYFGNMSATLPVINLAEFDGRDKERAELEQSLSGDFYGFLREQWTRIKTALEGSPEALDSSFWDNEKSLMLTSILGGLVKVALKLITMSFTDTEAIFNIGADWGMANEMALKWAREFSGEQIAQVTDTTKRAVKAAVSNWIETGGTLKDLQNTLEPTFGKERAKRIATNEVTKAYAEGNVIGWKSSGMADLDPKKKPVDDSHIGCRCWLTIQPRNGQWVYVWQTANDDRVCPICGPLHDQDVGIARKSLGNG